MAGAQAASRSARTWNIAGIIFGSVTLVLVNVIWIPIVVIAKAKEDDNGDYYG